MRIRVVEKSIKVKKLLVSHTDLDGAGSLFLAKYFNNKLEFTNMISRDYDFEKDEEDFRYLLSFDEIVIADLSISQEKTLELRAKGIKVTFFDHHESAEWLKDEKESEYSLEHCGTYLFWNFYVKKFITDYPVIIDELISLINTYDLWQQDNILWERAKNLNNVLYGIKDYSQKDNFEAMMPFFNLLESKVDHLTSWTETSKEVILIEKAAKREEEMYQKAIKMMKIRLDKKGKLFGTFALTSKISIVCSRILEEQENLDYLVCFNTWAGLNGKLSFRSRESFNCNDLGAAHGHDCAAGGKITVDQAFNMMEDSSYVFTYNEDYKEEDLSTAIERIT